MATIPSVVTPLNNPGEVPVWIAVWGPMANGDIGVPLDDMWNYADRSVQVEGTFGAGGSCAFEGTNDKTNYRVLTNPQGVALNITSASINQTTEACLIVRPHVTAGDINTSLTVTLFLRHTTPQS